MPKIIYKMFEKKICSAPKFQKIKLFPKT